MTPSDMPNSSDRDWLAWCYLLDELEVGERERFEEQLLTDQAAREALAGAVALYENLQATRSSALDAATTRPLPISISTQRSRRPRTLAWAVLTAAACMTAIAVGISFERQSGSDPPVTTSSEQLAVAWSRARQQSQNALQDASFEPLLLEAVQTSELATGESPSWEVEEPPAWLIAAVSASERRTIDPHADALQTGTP